MENNNGLHLKDKIALVTGSTRGLGYATALQLAKEGCKVAINGQDETTAKKPLSKFKRNRSSGDRFAGDASLPDVPAQLVQQTVDAFGGMDILITNTGGPKPGSIDSLDEAARQSGIDLCLMAHVRLIKSALPHCEKSQAASILTVTSLTVNSRCPTAHLEQRAHGDRRLDQVTRH